MNPLTEDVEVDKLSSLESSSLSLQTLLLGDELIDTEGEYDLLLFLRPEFLLMNCSLADSISRLLIFASSSSLSSSAFLSRRAFLFSMACCLRLSELFFLDFDFGLVIPDAASCNAFSL